MSPSRREHPSLANTAPSSTLSTVNEYGSSRRYTSTSSNPHSVFAMDHTLVILPLQAPRKEPGLHILDLPAEILDHICRVLCFHCQEKHAVIASRDILPPAFEDQKALSRFSQCSRRLREIAQPILFHWFHDGEEGGIRAKEVSRLARFLRAIIGSPTLAASTQALALYRRGQRPEFEDTDGFFRRAVEALGGYLPYLWHPRTQGLSLESLQELAMASTPAMSQLCLLRESRITGGAWELWDYSMPSLKYLAFAGSRTLAMLDVTYDLREARSLLRCAPNLDTLVAPDCWGGGPGSVYVRQLFSGQRWDVPLARLKTLSVNNASLEYLGTILRTCTVLEDLEYFDEHQMSGLLSLDDHLGHLRTTLRRLCYSVFPAELDDQISESETVQTLQEWFWEDPYKPVDPCYPDFSSFPVLEQLELEQLVLYGPVFPTSSDPREDRSNIITTPSHIFRKLPRSLRRLRIGYVTDWPVIYRDLLALAEEPGPSPRPFPLLQEVAVEVFTAPPEHQHKNLGERLRSVLGVTLLVYYVARSESVSRGLLPARPGRPKLVREPVLYS